MKFLKCSLRAVEKTKSKENEMSFQFARPIQVTVSLTACLIISLASSLAAAEATSQCGPLPELELHQTYKSDSQGICAIYFSKKDHTDEYFIVWTGPRCQDGGKVEYLNRIKENFFRVARSSEDVKLEVIGRKSLFLHVRSKNGNDSHTRLFRQVEP